MRGVRRAGFVVWIVLSLTASSLPLVTATAGAAPATPAPRRTDQVGTRGAPVSPGPVVVSQPDGRKITIERHGDGVRHWSSTPDGAALAQSTDGTYYYAERTDSDGQLVAGTQRPDLTPVAPKASEGLVPTQDPREVSASGAPSSGGDPEIGSFANDHRDTGTARSLVILASFSDQPGTTTASFWNNLFFGASGSVRDHYKVSSYNKLDVAPVAETSGTSDGVVGWVNLGFAHPALDDVRNSNSRPTITAAIQAANPFVNFSQFDTNANGQLEPWELHVTVIMAGFEASYTGWQNCGTAVWGHQWTLVSPPTLDGVRVGGNGFTTFGERHCSQLGGDDHGATLGIIAHEFGHDIGWPDLYDYDGSSEGVGAWSLMGGGSWNHTAGGLSGNSPALPDAFLKSEESWVTPTKVTTANGVTVASAATTADVKQMLDNPGGVDWGSGSPGVGEYFLVENRQKTSYDVGLPGCGLLIWHINETALVNEDDAARLVDLEEADGRGDIDAKRNRGDTGDPYPGSNANNRFASDTNPNSRLNSGAASGVTVTITSTACAATMTMNVGAGTATVPANDALANATTVATGATVTGSTVGATLETGELAHASNRGGASIWWKVTPATSGSLTVETTGSGFDTLLAVYQGATVGTLSYVAENDDASGLGALSRVRFNVTAGATYRIAVDGYRNSAGTTASGAVTLKVTAAAVLAAPANDQWASAATITPNAAASVTVTGPSFGASRQAGEPATHAGNPGGASVWWKITPPAAGTLAFDTRTSGYDSILAVYTGASVAGLTPVANGSNDDENLSASLVTSAVPAFPVAGGTTYYVAVDGYGGGQGEVVLHSRYTSDSAPTAPTAPTNVVATYASGGVQVAWTAPDSTGGSPITSYTVTATPGGAQQTYTVGAGSGLRVAFNTLAPGTYTFAVNAVNGVGAGPASAASNPATVPDEGSSNDAFTGAVTLTPGVTAAGSNSQATMEQSEKPHASNQGGASLWWKVVAPGTGTFTVNTTGSGFDTLLSVYVGTAITNLVNVAENDDAGPGRQSQVQFRATSGTTYFIAVDGYRPLNSTPAVGAVKLRATYSATTLAVPANNAFSQAPSIVAASGSTVTTTGVSFGADKQSGEPLHAGLNGGSSVWWKITPTSSGTLALDTRGSGFDSALAVYTGSSVSSLTPVANASNDDEDYGKGISTSIVSAFPVAAGTSYYIAVDGYQGTQGQIVLHALLMGGDVGQWYHPVAPKRIMDSRPMSPQIGAYTTPWNTGTQRDVKVAGLAGVPANARAVVLNVTVTNATASSYLGIWPTGQSAPNPMVSSLNWSPGQTIPNAVTAKVGSNGRIRIYNAGGRVDVIIDVVGWYGSALGDGYSSVAPARIMDSRPQSPQIGAFSTPWRAGTQRDVKVAGVGGVPANATAVVLNLTVTGTTANSFLGIWPTGQAQPNPMVSSLNWSPGRTIPNAVTAKVGTNGRIRIYNAGGSADVIVDVAGYFQSGTGRTFHSLSPKRVLDSRPNAPQVGPYGTPWGSGGSRTVTLAGVAGVPSGAESVVTNVTVTAANAPSFLSVWPNGQPKPNPIVSSLNWNAGTTIANAVTARVGSSGKVVFYNQSGSVHVIADVLGYFA